MPPYTYQKGINLGGWLAQYDHAIDVAQHFATFITQRDIDQIASWGADHVRLPFECGFDEQLSCKYMDKCIDWCKKRNLGVLLDLHYIKGQSFNPAFKINPVFLPENAHVIQAAWEHIAQRFAGAGDEVRFELFNEAQDNTGYLWNQIYPNLIKAVRSHDKQRMLYIGSNKMNSVFALSSLIILKDEQIVYNFHYYDPHPFTHQCADFDDHMRIFMQKMQYPGDFPGLYEFMLEHPLYAVNNGYLLFKHNDSSLIRENLDEARKFMEYTGKPLYCGEFGVIEGAGEENALGWVRDCVQEFKRIGVGYAYWTYKLMDFGLVDEQSRIRFPKLVKAVFD